jgi:hypothetical protein
MRYARGMNELEKIAELSAEIAKVQARADLLRVERAKVMAAATKTSSTHVIGATAGMSHALSASPGRAPLGRRMPAPRRGS